MIRGVRYRRSFATIEDAAAFLDQLEVHGSEGVLGGAPPAPDASAWMDEFLELAAVEKADSTRENYRYALGKLGEYLDAQGITDLRRVTTRVLERYKTKRLKAGSQRAGTVQPGTVNQELTLISAWLNRAVKIGLLETNPCQNVEKLRVPDRPPKFLTVAEAESLLTGALDHDRPLYALLYFTGLRPTEALYLTWADIDFDAGTVVVRAKDGWEPKGRRSRVVPLHADLVPYLTGLLVTGRWVFANANGEQRKYHSAKANFARLCKRLGIDKGGLHVWRHTFATRLVESTGHVKVV